MLIIPHAMDLDQPTFIDDPPSSPDIEARATITHSQNEFLKRRARAESITVKQLAGRILGQQLDKMQQYDIEEQRRTLRDMYGPQWKELIKKII